MSARLKRIFLIIVVSAIAILFSAVSFGNETDGKMRERIERLETNGKKNELEELLRSIVSERTGRWSIYVKNMTTGETAEVNADEKHYPASLVKLFCLGAVLESEELGKLEENETIDGELTKMITISDNWSFNDLVKRIGRDSVNLWIAANGYDSTEVRNGLVPSGNSDGIRSEDGKESETTARDCGKFLERVYLRTNVSREASSKMLNLLRNQTRKGKIPAGVPEPAETANKTGETDDVCHDAAVVWSPNADYVIVVMCTAEGNAWGRSSEIAEISKAVYAFFNPADKKREKER